MGFGRSKWMVPHLNKYRYFSRPKYVHLGRHLRLLQCVCVCVPFPSNIDIYHNHSGLTAWHDMWATQRIQTFPHGGSHESTMRCAVEPCAKSTVSLLHLDSAHVQKNEIAVTGQRQWHTAAFVDQRSFPVWWLMGIFSHCRCEMFVSQGSTLAQIRKE